MEIALALGGGGVKGAAHIGVLRRLEKEKIQIKALAGTSAGGLIGSLYAAGYTPQEILETFGEVDQSHMYDRSPEDGPALLGVKGVHRLLEKRLGNITFDDLRLKFVVTAVDLNSGREILLNKGRVADAVLATIAMPGIFPPQKWENYDLVDGGVLDPVPVAPVRSMALDLPVVAVVLTAPPKQPIVALEPPNFMVANPVIRQIARLRVAQAFNIFVHSVEIASCWMTEMRLEIDKPDVIVRPNVQEFGLLEQVDVIELAMRGEQELELQLPSLHRKSSWFARAKRIMQWRTLPLLDEIQDVP